MPSTTSRHALHLVPLGDRKVFAVGKADRITFLNGLVSNDMTAVTPETSVYSTVLTPQGKFLFEFFALTLADADATSGLAETGSLLIETEAARIDDLRKKLRMYKLRSKVEIGETDPTLHVMALFGDGAAQAVGLPPHPGATRVLDIPVPGIRAVRAFIDPRSADLGVRLVVDSTPTGKVGPEDSVEAVATCLGVAVGERGQYDRLRISLGVPDGSRDMIVEKSTLLESNIDKLNGISWDKGCYMGQELTARTRYRGLVKKRLMPLRLTSGAMPATGAEVTLDNAVVGEIRSVADDLALASVKLEAAASSGSLMAGGAALCVMDNPTAEPTLQEQPARLT